MQHGEVNSLLSKSTVRPNCSTNQFSLALSHWHFEFLSRSHILTLIFVFWSLSPSRYKFLVDPSTCTVGQFKERISAQCGVPPARQKIFGLPANNAALLSRVKPTDGQQFLLWRTKFDLHHGDSSSIAPVINEDSLWEALPLEVQYMIFGRLDPYTLLKCSSVSRSWKEMAKDDWLWDEKLAERWNTIDALPRVSGNASIDEYAEGWRIERNWMQDLFKRSVFRGIPASCLAFRDHGYLALCEQASIDTEKTFDTAEERFANAYDLLRADSILAVPPGVTSTLIEVGNVWSGESRKQLRAHTNAVHALAFAGVHSLISGDDAGNLILWDLYRSEAALPWAPTSSEFVAKRTLKRSGVTVLSVFDSRILFGNQDGDVGILDAERGLYPLHMISNAHNQSSITHFACSKTDPNLIASSSHSPFVKLWDPRSGISTMALYADPSSVSCLQFGFEHQLLTGGSSGVHFWDLRMHSLLYKTNTDSVTGMFYDGTRLITGTNHFMEVVKVGSRGIPDQEADIDVFKAQEHLRKQAVAQRDFEDPLRPRRIRVPASHIFCPNPAQLICLSSQGPTGLDFSGKRRVSRRAADSTFDPEDDYIPSPGNRMEE